MITQTELDKLQQEYETKDFITDDPIRFCHKFKTKKDIEIAGFISSLVAYGRRDVFTKKLDELFQIAEEEPYNFITNFEPQILGDFNYRFGKTNDFALIFNILKDLYNTGSSLEELFKYGWENHENLFVPVSDYFYTNTKEITQGFSFMIPDANKGSAMKRMCMYLRWMVRKSCVDLGTWNFMPTSDLLIPLDTHVARISRELGLLTRKQNDFKAVKELTDNLKHYCPEDPTKYDFALFGYGITHR